MWRSASIHTRYALKYFPIQRITKSCNTIFLKQSLSQVVGLLEDNGTFFVTFDMFAFKPLASFIKD